MPSVSVMFSSVGGRSRVFMTGCYSCCCSLCLVPAAANTPLWFGQPTLSLLLQLTTWRGKCTNALPASCVSVIVPRSCCHEYSSAWSGVDPELLLEAVHHHLPVEHTFGMTLPPSSLTNQSAQLHRLVNISSLLHQSWKIWMCLTPLIVVLGLCVQ